MRVTDVTPPREIAFSEIEPGQSVEQDLIFTEGDVEAFRRLAKDHARIHADPEFARTQGFDGPIVFGFQIASRFSRLLGMYLPGEHSVIKSVQLDYRKPVLIGELQ